MLTITNKDMHLMRNMIRQNILTLIHNADNNADINHNPLPQPSKTFLTQINEK